VIEGELIEGELIEDGSCVIALAIGPVVIVEPEPATETRGGSGEMFAEEGGRTVPGMRA
jgi:hypothetical protein